MPRDTDTAQILSTLILISRRGVSDARTAEIALSMTAQSIVGYIVDNPGCRAADIARDFRLNRSTVSRQLGDLVRAGLVDEIESPGRGRPLALTPAGERAYRETIAVLTDAVAGAMHDWPDGDVDRFARDLARFTAGARAD
ncbi:MarR family winged helix-turn-helix transcriptional regulator [Microbacterium horticulturae]|uniref:MarR family winged helix-turn-helix transcriptional regulator n=1 Tax=Microbacterium horticulturae TaxID=3028316 RepID=A0ABY8BXJ3_9MICO|nr:MarR family winged helix-turn-helix transcriptional regulator [Microbacterium sp. KACC 23027]WEG08884.1 MarR family winged helix-turn-helix transcriptional regulator [Microbacterium sp. KACC 23027]